MSATLKTSMSSTRRSSCGGSAPVSNRRVSTGALGGRLPPGLQTVEDFRVSGHSLQDLHQPSLPPALQSMEAFKTRQSFLTGKCGFNSAQCGSSAAPSLQSEPAQWSSSLTLSVEAPSSSGSEAESSDALETATFDLDLGGDTDTEDDIF